MALASASTSRPAPTPPTPASSHSPSSTSLPSSSSSPPSPAPTSPSTSSPTHPAPVLPKAHPLAAELLSLRQQLSQYRQAAHQASIDVQGVRLELDLAKEEAGGLRTTNAALTAEVDTLRNTPNPPAAASPSNALAELSLAHRRLSAKLDFTEQQLGSVSLELASTRQELQRTQREREGERAVLVELRRIEEDREEECQFERSERQRIEEQKKLVDLALNEYAALVARLDPSAVPPAVPNRAVDNVLQQPPALTAEVGETDAAAARSDQAPVVPPKEDQSAEQSEQPKDELTAPTAFIIASTSTDSVDALASSPPAAPEKDLPTTPSLEPRDPLAITTSADAISNLLIGQRGVHRLFKDFSTAIHAKDRQVHTLQTKCDGLEARVRTLREQLESETTVRVEAQSDRDRVLRDDASAAKVVERYMTFSQKAHQTVHMHLGQQRQRASATQASLRAEGAAYRHRMRSEVDRSARLRAACEEMADELGRESAGRRREVALRLSMIAADEARAHRAEGWLDRVRRARESTDGAAATALNWTALVDEAVEILAPAEKDKGADKPSSSGGGFRARFLRRKAAMAQPTASAPPSASSHEDQSLARIFLAEELVQNLVADLQVETERRIELERQRVAWLAKEAEDGVPAASGEAGGVMFDMDDEEKKSEEEVKDEHMGDKDATKEDGGKSDADEPGTGPTTSAPEPPRSPPVPPEMDELTTMFEQLEARYQPLQKSLHDQAHSLQALRTSLPPPPEASGKRASVGRALALRPARTAHDDLVAILDGLHEVIEDARVDAEIAVADEDRQFHGFAALLGVGASGVVQATSVLRDARAYADVRSGPDTPYARLSARVGDIEGDLALVKTTLHEAQGMHEVEEDAGASAGKGRRRTSAWATVALRTVSSRAHAPHPTPQHQLHLAAALVDDDHTDEDSPGSGARTPVSGGPLTPRAGLFSSVGRTLSSGVVGAASGVAGAPRRVSDFAGGLYRPRAAAVRTPTDEQAPLVEDSVSEEREGEGAPDDDDVE